MVVHNIVFISVLGELVAQGGVQKSELVKITSL